MTLEDTKYTEIGTAEAETQASENRDNVEGEVYWNHYLCRPEKAIINRRETMLTPLQVQDYMNQFEYLLRKGLWIEAGLECIEEGLPIRLVLEVNSTLMAEAKKNGDKNNEERFMKYDKKIKYKTKFKQFGDEYSIEKQERVNKV